MLHDKRVTSASEAPAVIERMLRAYLEHRETTDDSFNDFVRKHPTDALKAWFEESQLVSA